MDGHVLEASGLFVRVRQAENDGLDSTDRGQMAVGSADLELTIDLSRLAAVFSAGRSGRTRITLEPAEIQLIP